MWRGGEGLAYLGGAARRGCLRTLSAAMALASLVACGHPSLDASGRPVAMTRLSHDPDRQPAVAYPGPVALTRREFPQGFPLSLGSGLSFKSRQGDRVELWALTDRGPNGEGPRVDGHESKLFPAPDYHPAFGVIGIEDGRVLLISITAIRMAERPLTGVPHALEGTGSSGEVALGDGLRRLPADDAGIDPESIAWDGDSLWIGEEYGPSILQVAPATGQIKGTLKPGDGLPASWLRRRPNRGLELLAYDAETRRLNVALQSNIKSSLPSIPWVELDPVTRQFREYAYPLNVADYQDGDPGKAKLGDMVALGGGRFVVIEQGRNAEGEESHRLFLVDHERLPLAATDGMAIRPMTKTLLLDLDQAGWSAEKAEGLALIDPRTLIVSNDNDFGMTTTLVDAHEHPVSGKIESCRLVGQRLDANGKHCPRKAVLLAASRLPDTSGVQQFWRIRFADALRSR